MLKDTQAAIDELKKEGPVAIVGFCMGGSIAFLAATRLSGISCAIAYYGGQIAKFADEKPKVPMQMHFGEKDQGIPMTDVETIKAKRTATAKSTSIRTPAHGFHCDERGSFHEASAKAAWPRFMDFLKKHLKK